MSQKSQYNIEVGGSGNGIIKCSNINIAIQFLKNKKHGYIYDVTKGFLIFKATDITEMIFIE